MSITAEAAQDPLPTGLDRSERSAMHVHEAQSFEGNFAAEHLAQLTQNAFDRFVSIDIDAAPDGAVEILDPTYDNALSGRVDHVSVRHEKNTDFAILIAGTLHGGRMTRDYYLMPFGAAGDVDLEAGLLEAAGQEDDRYIRNYAEQVVHARGALPSGGQLLHPMLTLTSPVTAEAIARLHVPNAFNRS